MLGLLPNVITALRFLLLPFFGWSVVTGRTALAPVLLGAIAFSDFLDGFLARRYRAESRLGAFLDPVADKLTQLSGLVLLSIAPDPTFTRIPVAFIALVLARELLLSYGALRVRLLRGGVRIRPRFEGKASTAVIFALLLAACLGAPRWTVWALCVVGAPFVLASGVRYVIDGYRQMKEGAPGDPSAGGT